MEAELQEAASAAVMVEEAGGEGEEVGVGNVAIRLLVDADEELLNLQLDAYVQEMDGLQTWCFK